MATPDAAGSSGRDAGPDAAVVCPTSGWLTISGSSSTYDVVSNSNELVSWWIAEQRCEAMGPGIHLVVFETTQEAAGLASHYTSNKIYYLGTVQPGLPLHSYDGWRPIVAAPTISFWATNEPNDGGPAGSIVESGNEQALVADQSGRFRDENGHNAHNYICECDGKPLDPTVNIPQP